MSVNFAIGMFSNLRQIGHATCKGFITVQREKRLSRHTQNNRLHLNPLTIVHTLAVATYSAPSTNYNATNKRQGTSAGLEERRREHADSIVY